MTPKTILENALTLLDNGNAWVQKYVAVDKDGIEVDPCEGCKFCPLGAIYRAVTDAGLPLYSDEHNAAANILLRQTPYDSVVIWNDAAGRTFADVREVFHYAIADAP